LKNKHWSKLIPDVATNDDIEIYYDGRKYVEHEVATLSYYFGNQFDGLYGDDLCRALLQSLSDEGGEITSCHSIIGRNCQDIRNRLVQFSTDIDDGYDVLTWREKNIYFFLIGKPIFKIDMVPHGVITMFITSVLKCYLDVMLSCQITKLEYCFSRSQLTLIALKAAGFPVPYEYSSNGSIKLSCCNKWDELEPLVTNSQICAKHYQFKKWLSTEHNITISEYFDLAALVYKIFGSYWPMVDEEYIIIYGQSVKRGIWPATGDGPKFNKWYQWAEEDYGNAVTAWSPEILESASSFSMIHDIVRALHSVCSSGDAGRNLSFVTSLKVLLVPEFTAHGSGIVGAPTTIQIDDALTGGDFDATMSVEDLLNLRLSGVDDAHLQLLSGAVAGGISCVPRDSVLQVSSVLQRYIESRHEGSGINMLARYQALSRLTAVKLASQGILPLDGSHSSPQDSAESSLLFSQQGADISDDDIYANDHSFRPWLRSQYGLEHEEFMEILKSAYYYAGLTLPQKPLDEVIAVGRSDEAKAYTIILDIKFLLTSACKILQFPHATKPPGIGIADAANNLQQSLCRMSRGEVMSEDRFQRILSEVNVRIDSYDQRPIL